MLKFQIKIIKNLKFKNNKIEEDGKFEELISDVLNNI
jgi:hypothetical protein